MGLKTELTSNCNYKFVQRLDMGDGLSQTLYTNGNCKLVGVATFIPNKRDV